MTILRKKNLFLTQPPAAAAGKSLRGVGRREWGHQAQLNWAVDWKGRSKEEGWGWGHVNRGNSRHHDNP